jgi:hypothetical protein
MDTASLPMVLFQQHDLSPTSTDWLSNWETVFRNQALLRHSRPLTRYAVMQALQSVYDSVKDMPRYRMPLADLVFDFCERQILNGDQDDEVTWRILGDEVVLRTIEMKELNENENSSTSRVSRTSVVEHIITVLSTASLGCDIEDVTPIAVADTSSPQLTLQNSSPAASHFSKTTSDHVETTTEKDPTLPSVMSILQSFTAGNQTHSRSIESQALDDQDLEFTSPTPERSSSNRAASAVVALVNIFCQLSFTPFSLSETNLTLAVRIYLTIVDVLVKGLSTMAKLTALQFLTRLRADRDHRVYFVDNRYDPDGHIYNWRL